MSVLLVKMCVDDGGPSRELMPILIKEIERFPIFCGGTQKILVIDSPSFNNNMYKLTGQMIGYMIVHRDWPFKDS